MPVWLIVLIVLVAAIIVVGAVAWGGDLQRYLRMRRM